MTFSTIRLTALGVMLAGAASTARAQVSFPEVEPNGPKAEATPASCLVAGDTLDGTSTGTSAVAANPAVTSADTFLVQTCALPLAIYQHDLVITSATVGHTGTIRGLNQTGTVGVGGTAGTTDTTVQTSSTATVPPRMNRWYGFGRGEQLYYRVAGAAATTAPYVSTLSTTSVAPAVIGPYAAGSITFTTVAQGHTTDTELALYDATLTAIPGALNDDHFGGATLQSALTRTLSAGRYYLAVTRFNFADNRTAAADDDFVAGALMDFADSAVDSVSGAAAVNVAFAVTDTAGTTPVAASLANSYGILWFKFDVVPPSSITAMCEPGVAGVMACVCGNPNGPGAGCANMGGPGASLAGSGTPDVSADSLVLTGSGMFLGSACIFLQGNALVAGGTPFGAGIRCAGGSLKRLYVKAVTGGMSIAPVGADPTISAQSAALGDVITNGFRWYQVYYRDPSLPNPGGACPPIATFNATSGVAVYWLP